MNVNFPINYFQSAKKPYTYQNLLPKIEKQTEFSKGTKSIVKFA